MLFRPGVLPYINFLMAAPSSSIVKLASGMAALESEVTSRDVQRATSVPASGKRPLFRSCEAMTFAVHFFLECVVLLSVTSCQLVHGLPRFATWMCEFLQQSSHPGMYCLLKSGMFFATPISMLQYTVNVASVSSAPRCGRHGVLLSVSAMNISQLAFRKFHLLTGLPVICWTSNDTLMIDCRWCDREKLSMMRRSGSGRSYSPWRMPGPGWCMCSIVQGRSSGLIRLIQ